MKPHQRSPHRESHHHDLCPLDLAYPQSYGNLEEMMAERGVAVDHSNIYRWVQTFTPKLEAVFRKGRKRPVVQSWRMDETYTT